MPFKWYPVSEIVRQALAWRLLDVTESNGTPGRPRHPHQVPELPRAPPAQGGVALPPAPRGLRPLRHRVLLLHRAPEDAPGARGHPRHGRAALSASAGASSRSRATWPTASPATTASPASRSTRPRSSWAGTAPTSYGDFLFYAGRLDRLKRVDLALEALARTPRARPADDRRATGPLEGRAREARAAPRASKTGWTSSASSPTRTSLALYAALPRGLLRPAQRGLRLRHRGVASSRASPCSPPPTPAGRSSS